MISPVARLIASTPKRAAKVCMTAAADERLKDPDQALA
jgi:hypothetical protein